MLTSLQALLRLATLRWLGVFICALATLLAMTSSASALEPAQTKTRVWGFDFAEHNSVGLFRAASSGKHQGNWLARAEEASGSLLAAEGTEATRLFHYTNEAGHAGILESEALNPSLKALNPADARYGNGQYLSDILPGSKTPAQLSREFLGMPFQGSRFTHFLEVDVTGLNVVQGRAGVFVVPNEAPLNLAGRIVSSGRVP